jgi:hypothetical protein
VPSRSRRSQKRKQSESIPEAEIPTTRKIDLTKHDAEAIGALVEVFAVLNRWYEERAQ